jgi:hypothetical protein
VVAILLVFFGCKKSKNASPYFMTANLKTGLPLNYTFKAAILTASDTIYPSQLVIDAVDTSFTAGGSALNHISLVIPRFTGPGTYTIDTFFTSCFFTVEHFISYPFPTDYYYATAGFITITAVSGNSIQGKFTVTESPAVLSGSFRALITH